MTYQNLNSKINPNWNDTAGIGSGPPGGQLFWAFLILSAVTIVYAIFWAILTKVRILEVVKEDHSDSIDQREELPFKQGLELSFGAEIRIMRF